MQYLYILIHGKDSIHIILIFNSSNAYSDSGDIYKNTINVN